MNKRATKGFTLIELLVASGVTAIIVGLMITMVSNLLTAYNRSSGALSAQSQAGFVLDQMASEIESMVLRNSDEVMLAATIRDGTILGTGSSQKPDGDSLEIQSVPAPAAPGDTPVDQGVILPIEQQRFGIGGVWLRFFSSAPSLSNDPNSGVRAIGYQIRFNPVTSASSAPEQYMLYRSEVPAQETFDTGYELNPSGGDYGYGGTLLTNPGEAQIIAGNVVDFGIRLFGTNSYRERELLFPLDSADLEYLASGTGSERYPRAIEVMIRIVTPEGVRLLDAKREQGALPDTTWWEIVEQNSEVFSRVINIPSRPL